MNGADPLAELRDWRLPDPVSWWPPAPGWWILAALALAGLIVLTRRWMRARRRRAPVRAALKELAAIRADFAADGDSRRLVLAVSQLLRRLALVYWPRDRVAGLSGVDWLAFLDATGGAGGFARGAGQVLADAGYRPPGAAGDVDVPALLALAEVWIDAHRRRPSAKRSWIGVPSTPLK